MKIMLITIIGKIQLSNFDTVNSWKVTKGCPAVTMATACYHGNVVPRLTWQRPVTMATVSRGYHGNVLLPWQRSRIKLRDA